MKKYANPDDECNSPKYRTGKKCVNQGCMNLAGTAWSPYWCQPCNAKRIEKIDAALDSMLKETPPQKESEGERE